MYKEKSYKFLLIILISFIICTFFTSKVSAATYDLSDYKNCSLVGGKFVVIYSYDNDKIYLLTLERADYPYFCTTKHADSTDKKTISVGAWISCCDTKDIYGSQGHVKYYTFNPNNNKFENRKNAGIGTSAFNPGKCEIIASNANIIDFKGTTFFTQTPISGKVLINPTIAETMSLTLEKAQVLEKMKTTITGYLKYLIAFVISVIAFWKGWQFLSKNFRKA